MACCISPNTPVPSPCCMASHAPNALRFPFTPSDRSAPAMFASSGSSLAAYASSFPSSSSSLAPTAPTAAHNAPAPVEDAGHPTTSSYMSSSDHTLMPSLPSTATLPSAYGGTMSMPPSLVLQFAAAPSNTQHNAYGSGHGNTLSQSSYAPIQGLLSAAHQLGGLTRG